MSELKPCPFCGSEVQDDERGEKYPRKSPMGGWIIHCECCGASLSQFRKSGKGEISWNTRPIEDALQARIAELEGHIGQLFEAGNEIVVEYCGETLSDYGLQIVKNWQAVNKNWKEREK